MQPLRLDMSGAVSTEPPRSAEERQRLHDQYQRALALGGARAPRVTQRATGADWRAEALRQARGRVLPPPRVRSDYFGTDEHLAAAQRILTILRGNNPFGPGVQSSSHVLLRFKDGARPAPFTAPVHLGSLEVASAIPEWQQRWLRELRDLQKFYQPNRELPIRAGLSLRYGEIVTLAGDYYETEESLRAELTDEVAEDVRKVTPESPGTGWLTHDRGFVEYLRLALGNKDHFTPHNWIRYLREHGEALRLALGRDLDRALVRNAFADHFLSDAFATGHMRTPRARLGGVGGGLRSHRMHDEENRYGLWVENGEGMVWRAYGDGQLGTNQIHLMLTALALGRSLVRVYRAFRAEGEEAKALQQALTAAQEERFEELPRTPLELPRLLGDLGLGWPAIASLLPKPLAERPQPGGRDELWNYPPLFGTDLEKRKGKVDFEAFFRFGA